MLLAGIKLSSYYAISRKYENMRKKLDSYFFTYIIAKQRLHILIQVYEKSRHVIFLQVDYVFLIQNQTISCAQSIQVLSMNLDYQSLDLASIRLVLLGLRGGLTGTKRYLAGFQRKSGWYKMRPCWFSRKSGWYKMGVAVFR